MGARDQILNAIETGQYRPGDRLPSEAELGDALGVSRASVRSALRALEAIGLVEIRHGRGTFVAMGPGARYLGPFAAWLTIHREDVLDLMKVRGALDELAAAEAAGAETGHDNTELIEANRRFAEAAHDSSISVDEVVQLDIAFHIAIARASRSLVLPQLLTDLNQLLNESRRAVFATSDRAKGSAREHQAIVDAIIAKDSERARSAAAKHLEVTRKLLSDPSSFSDHGPEETRPA